MGSVIRCRLSAFDILRSGCGKDRCSVGDFHGSGKLGFLVASCDNSVDTMSLFLPTAFAISPALFSWLPYFSGGLARS